MLTCSTLKNNQPSTLLWIIQVCVCVYILYIYNIYTSILSHNGMASIKNEDYCFFLTLFIDMLEKNSIFKRVSKILKRDYYLRMSVCLSIRVSAWNYSASTERIFMKFDL
jgi:hypothetical protein